MKPKLLFGLVAAALLVVPAAVQAQRGGGAGGGRSGAGSSGAMAFSGGAVRSSSASIRRVPSVSVVSSSSVTRPRSNPFSVYGVQVPYRLTGTVGSSSLGLRVPHHGGVAGSGGGSNHRYPHQPHGTYPQFYFLTGGGYYYPAPDYGDDSEGQPQDAAATDQQQVTGEQDAGQQAEQAPDDEQRDARAELSSAAPAPEQQEAAPLPDVGSFTLVMRDGTQVDALAFTRSQDKIIYITPDGGRRTVAVSDIDSDSTERVNEERGTPLQLPL